MHIGALTISSNLFLAPLAGYTNLPFRLVLRELGGLGLATTDLVNARSLIEKNPKALKLIETCPTDRPLSIQLFGSVPEEMRDAAVIAEAMGASVVDINMGCPVRKVCHVGGGSAMMIELEKTARLAKGMIDAVKIPVTAKMRLGWDEENLTAPDLARALVDSGIAAITVHGRTRAQGFGGGVNLAGIRSVVEAVSNIPVIGNGDVTSPEAARKMIEETGCAGLAIGRGAFYNPWIFHHTRHYLSTGELLPPPGFEERIELMRRHLEWMIRVFGEALACRMFRKVGPWYARCFGPAREFNRKIVTIQTLADFESVLAGYREWRKPFLDENGELKPNYRSQAMASCFHQEAGSPPPALPAPKGPVDLW